MEAPPGRDKNLVPMGNFGKQEKVEVYAVATFTNKLIIANPLIRLDSKVKAAAVLADKTSMELGSAEVSPFPKVTDDGRRTLLSISVSRLPDKPVATITFSGFVRLQVANGISRKTSSFEPKVGSRIDIGLGRIAVAMVEANSVTFTGGDQLDRIAGLKISKPDGTTITGERGGYSRMGGTDGTVVQAQWSFSAPISAGKIEASVYDGLETVDVPIKLTIAKPY